MHSPPNQASQKEISTLSLPWQQQVTKDAKLGLPVQASFVLACQSIAGVRASHESKVMESENGQQKRRQFAAGGCEEAHSD